MYFLSQFLKKLAYVLKHYFNFVILNFVVVINKT